MYHRSSLITSKLTPSSSMHRYLVTTAYKKADAKGVVNLSTSISIYLSLSIYVNVYIHIYVKSSMHRYLVTAAYKKADAKGVANLSISRSIYLSSSIYVNVYIHIYVIVDAQVLGHNRLQKGRRKRCCKSIYIDIDISIYLSV